MTAYRRVYDSRHLQADCKEPGSAPERYARQSNLPFSLLKWLFVESAFGEREGTRATGPSHKATTTVAVSISFESRFLIIHLSAVFACIGALGTPSRTGPLARKYLAYRVSLTVDLCEG